MVAAMKPKPTPNRGPRHVRGETRDATQSPTPGAAEARTATDADVSSASPWSVRKRAIASVLIALHLAAIFSAPCAGPPPSSQLERDVAGVFDPYLQAAFLNHGYRFFAPNPGPSHLVRFEMKDADGKTKTGRFPDLASERPRLLYHRHFMLSETIFNLTRSLTDPPRQFTSTEEHEAYEREARAARAMVEPLLTAVAQSLAKEHEAGESAKIELFAVQHDIPRPEQVLEGMKLSDSTLWREQPLGEWSAKEGWRWDAKIPGEAQSEKAEELADGVEILE